MSLLDNESLGDVEIQENPCARHHALSERSIDSRLFFPPSIATSIECPGNV